ncbi:MerR family transcriptional regulator [Sphingomonas aerophila]|jgi:DNA-binding transcriptional MerR regulator|uniref:DNA-binding transcriptional MerR regulator n=1 Tax=Sphingomonas aerophila TaxID=1344948 RepID=A0A7W9BAH4_9SPHN|nr:MerR family transcriptional regulator [Sphingomonas aerophila]MBB5713627.1 DNA-binding transcriptional MerR regulator [Sphingomonas aerophila]
MPASPSKAEGAFRTIGELSRDTGLPQHVLRYWETRFPQLKPLTRAGGRRYYRAEDVALVRRIDQWLNRDGYTVRGVQQLLSTGTPPSPSAPATQAPAPGAPATAPDETVTALRAIRDLLAQALVDDDPAKA